jgi:hypothetical protein
MGDRIMAKRRDPDGFSKAKATGEGFSKSRETGDDDVEGHSIHRGTGEGFAKAKATPEGFSKSRAAGDEDDVEGHSFRLRSPSSRGE